MEWSEETMYALRLWLGPSTWYTRHPFDLFRYFDFIWAVWEDQGKIWDEAMAREIMTREFHALHPDWKGMEDRIDEYRSEGTNYLDFLSRAREKGRICWSDPRTSDDLMVDHPTSRKKVAERLRASRRHHRDPSSPTGTTRPDH